LKLLVALEEYSIAAEAFAVTKVSGCQQVHTHLHSVVVCITFYLFVYAVLLSLVHALIY
jgi:hypothetical protein